MRAWHGMVMLVVTLTLGAATCFAVDSVSGTSAPTTQPSATQPAAPPSTQSWIIREAPPPPKVRRRIVPSNAMEPPWSLDCPGFSFDGRYLVFASQHRFFDREVNLWRLLLWHWPELLFVTCLLVWLVLLRRFWKRHVRPRWVRRDAQHGEPTCTNCGYQLTGVVSKSCPECGAPIKTKAASAPIALGLPRRLAWGARSSASSHCQSALG